VRTTLASRLCSLRGTIKETQAFSRISLCRSPRFCQSRGTLPPDCHKVLDRRSTHKKKFSHSQLTLTQNLGVLKSTVLPHFLQNLRYIQSTTDVKKLQTRLNLSLTRALPVHGDHTALLADTGVPLRALIQYTHLAQLHFRLTKTRSDTLPATLFKTFNKSLALSNHHPSTLDYHIRNSVHQFRIDPLVDPLPRMATLPHKSRERAYRNILRTTISTLWRMELLTHAHLQLPHINSRKASYIHIARDDLQRRDLIKPAQYLRSHLDQLPLLCLQTQATSYIPH